MIHLKKEERQLLWRKYINNGLSYDEADFKVKSTIKYLNDLVDRLRKQNKPELDIQERFAREFEKLINQ